MKLFSFILVLASMFLVVGCNQTQYKASPNQAEKKVPVNVETANHAEVIYCSPEIEEVNGFYRSLEKLCSSGKYQSFFSSKHREKCSHIEAKYHFAYGKLCACKRYNGIIDDTFKKNCKGH